MPAEPTVPRLNSQVLGFSARLFVSRRRFVRWNRTPKLCLLYPLENHSYGGESGGGEGGDGGGDGNGCCTEGEGGFNEGKVWLEFYSLEIKGYVPLPIPNCNHAEQLRLRGMTNGGDAR